MASQDETRRGGNPGRASELVIGSDDGSENSPDNRARQAQTLNCETAYDHGEPNVIAIYNGLDHLGSIAIGRSIRAITSDGDEIGRFATKEEARRAVVLAAFGGGLLP